MDHMSTFMQNAVKVIVILLVPVAALIGAVFGMFFHEPFLGAGGGMLIGFSSISVIQENKDLLGAGTRTKDDGDDL